MSCPRHTTQFVGDNCLQCLLPCPSGTVPSTHDIAICVSSSCPAPTTNDPNNMICNKRYVLATGPCPLNTTEWTPGYCYTECPPNMSDAATVCVKLSVVRSSVSPICSWGSSYESASGICRVSSQVIIAFLTTILCIAAIVLMSFLVRSSLGAAIALHDRNIMRR